MLGIFDSHSHYEDGRFDEDRDELLSSMSDRGVELIVNVGSSIDTTKKTIELIKKYPFVYGSAGVHPEECANLCDEDIDWLETVCADSKIVAVGEIGLDYYDLETQIAYIKEHSPEVEKLTEEIVKQKQKEIFIKQIELAEKMELPIVVHSRDATNETLEIIKANKDKLKFGGLIHCFSGSTEIAREYFKLGFYISVGVFRSLKKVQGGFFFWVPERGVK